MAKKYNSAYDGTPIQIKRTTLSLEDSKSAEKKAINNDGPLNYGEPLYLQYDVTEPNTRTSHTHHAKYMVIGEGESSGESKNKATSDLAVFKALPRNLAEGILFYDQKTRKPNDSPISTNGERVDLIDQEGLNIYTRFRTFTMRSNSTDPQNAPVDASGKLIKISMSGTWYKVDANGAPTTIVAGENDFPKVQYIPITYMTSDTVPYISLAIPNNILGNKGEIKQVRKAFGNITHVKSIDNQIIVYCGYKNLKRDCYIDVFGG